MKILKKAVDKIDSFLYYKQALEQDGSRSMKQYILGDEKLQKKWKKVLTNVETFDNIPKVLTRVQWWDRRSDPEVHREELIL